MIRYLECGCCGFYHKEDYEGDCRNDAECWTLQEIIEDIEGGTPDIEIVPLERQYDISCGGV
ncbi:MAG: hypothetical protein KAW56_15535 [Candidatus Marinimicrobia bacterium]|nr:hypothetical protein [Candidatus Neomarinimicrobiota bacterium]